MQPNHGWRHRFSSLSRDKGLREDVTIYMLGRQKSVSGAYGGAAVRSPSAVCLEAGKRLPKQPPHATQCVKATDVSTDVD